MASNGGPVPARKKEKATAELCVVTCPQEVDERVRQ